MEELQRIEAMITAARIGLVLSGLVLVVVTARVVWDRVIG